MSVLCAKVVYYAAKKGMWVYAATNGRLLRPEVANPLRDSGGRRSTLDFHIVLAQAMRSSAD